MIINGGTPNTHRPDEEGKKNMLNQIPEASRRTSKSSQDGGRLLKQEVPSGENKKKKCFNDTGTHTTKKGGKLELG